MIFVWAIIQIRTPLRTELSWLYLIVHCQLNHSINDQVTLWWLACLRRDLPILASYCTKRFKTKRIDWTSLVQVQRLALLQLKFSNLANGPMIVRMLHPAWILALLPLRRDWHTSKKNSVLKLAWIFLSWDCLPFVISPSNKFCYYSTHSDMEKMKFESFLTRLELDPSNFKALFLRNEIRLKQYVSPVKKSVTCSV